MKDRIICVGVNPELVNDRDVFFGLDGYVYEYGGVPAELDKTGLIWLSFGSYIYVFREVIKK